MAVTVLEFEGISKVFRSSLTGRRMYELGPLSFSVEKGEILGYLGPNGAGKTTTIKIAVGLLRPTAGRVVCFGRSSESIDARRRIGFMPEHPYFYQHLTARELMEFYGRLFGLSGRGLRSRALHLLEITGLEDVRDTPLSKFSKGMLQRIGLAQALIGDPDLVILDEPLTGLDPVGRHEMRELVLSLKAQGKTVFFSSHILQDVEVICDRVVILARGRIMRVVTLAEVLEESMRSVQIMLEGLDAGRVRGMGLSCTPHRGNKAVVEVAPDADVNAVIVRLMAAGGRISSVVPVRESLEEYFMRHIRDSGRVQHSRSAAAGDVWDRTGGGS
jgi:ABC-2 type transport system ATP-binding protein